jgi:hypothetical protein
MHEISSEKPSVTEGFCTLTLNLLNLCTKFTQKSIQSYFVCTQDIKLELSTV